MNRSCQRVPGGIIRYLGGHMLESNDPGRNYPKLKVRGSQPCIWGTHGNSHVRDWGLYSSQGHRYDATHVTCWSNPLLPTYLFTVPVHQRWKFRIQLGGREIGKKWNEEKHTTLFRECGHQSLLTFEWGVGWFRESRIAMTWNHSKCSLLCWGRHFNSWWEEPELF